MSRRRSNSRFLMNRVAARWVNRRRRRALIESSRRVICRTALLVAVVTLVSIFSSACGGRGEVLDRAQAAWDTGDFVSAVAKYEEFLRNSPHDDQGAVARFRVANIYYYNLKAYEKAIQHYIHLLEDFPKSGDVEASRLRLAECYVALGKRQEAINEYEGLLNAPNDAVDRRRIRLNIGELYYDLNDLGQALAEYEKVTADAPYDQLSERAWLRIAGIRFLRDEFEEGLSAYDVVGGNAKDQAVRRQARLGMADCYARTFQYDLAIKVLEQTEPDLSVPEYLQQRIAAIREEQRQRNFSLAQTARP